MEHLLADERLLSELDHVRLTHLVRRTPAAAGGPLDQLLDGAHTVMPREVPADLVTMNSRVQVADEKTGAPSVLTLSYPDEADAASGHVSVLSPLGAALLGRRVGATVSWSAPDGRGHGLVVSALEYQPELSGDYTA